MSNQKPTEIARTAVDVVLETSWPRTRLVLRVVIIALLTYYLFESARWIIVKLTGIILLLVLAIFAYSVAPLVEFPEPADTYFRSQVCDPARWRSSLLTC